MAQSVLPKFYDRDVEGLPNRWTEMVRHTLRTLGPQVLASRMVRDYAVGYYLPAAEAGRKALSDNFAGAKAMAAYRQRIERAWPTVKVIQVDASGLPDTPVIGAVVLLRACVDLGELTPADVLVQAIFGRVSANDDLSENTVVPMAHLENISGTDVFVIDAPLPLSGAVGYTVRVLPHNSLLASDAEFGLVATPSP
jgi:starch phosphorylase